MVLVGLDGTGKSTTVQLASHVAGCELYKLTLTRGYSHIDFRDDLKKVFRKAGVQGNNTVFLLTDSDIIHVSKTNQIEIVWSLLPLFCQIEIGSFLWVILHYGISFGCCSAYLIINHISVSLPRVASQP